MARAGSVDPEKEKYWRDVFKRFAKTELPFRKFCAQEGLNEGSFQQWRRKLRERDEISGRAPTIRAGENRASSMQAKTAFWLRVIEDIEKSPGSIKQYLKKHDLSSGSLWYWERRLVKEGLTNGISPERKHLFVSARVAKAVDAESIEKSTRSVIGDSLRIEIRTSIGHSAFFPCYTPVDVLVRFINALDDNR